MNLDALSKNIVKNAPSLEQLKQRDPYTFNEIFELNTYGFHTSDVYGKSVLDIGAHKGYFTTLAACSGARMIVSIEPNAVNFTELKANVQHYRNVTLLNMACHNGYSDTMEPYGEDGTAKVRPGTGVESRGLEQLSQLLPSSRVLKMDCEGSEFDILVPASAALLRSFDILFMEVHGEGEGHRSVRFIKDYLYFVGFDIAFTHPVMWTTFGPDGKPVKSEKIRDIEILKFKRAR